MKFLRSILKWKSSEKIAPKQAEKVIYRWTSALPPILSPYTYVVKVPPAYRDRSIGSARRVRSVIFPQLYGKNSFVYADQLDYAASVWNEIIPSTERPATHRIEIGLLRKGSGSPKSPFFIEYFCFDTMHKSSDRIAIQIAGFVAEQLDEAEEFDGAAIKETQQTYWLLCIYAGWKEFKKWGY